MENQCLFNFIQVKIDYQDIDYDDVKLHIDTFR